MRERALTTPRGVEGAQELILDRLKKKNDKKRHLIGGGISSHYIDKQATVLRKMRRERHRRGRRERGPDRTGIACSETRFVHGAQRGPPIRCDIITFCRGESDVIFVSTAESVDTVVEMKRRKKKEKKKIKDGSQKNGRRKKKKMPTVYLHSKHSSQTSRPAWGSRPPIRSPMPSARVVLSPSSLLRRLLLLVAGTEAARP